MIGFDAVVVEIMSAATAAVALLAAIVSLYSIRRHRLLHEGKITDLEDEIRRGDQESLGRIRETGLNLAATLAETVAEAEKNTQANLELLRDGRLGMPARARALRLLRTGMSAETAAVELGLARNEVQLLEKVAALLAPRN